MAQGAAGSILIRAVQRMIADDLARVTIQASQIAGQLTTSQLPPGLLATLGQLQLDINLLAALIAEIEIDLGEITGGGGSGPPTVGLYILRDDDDVNPSGTILMETR